MDNKQFSSKDALKFYRSWIFCCPCLSLSYWPRRLRINLRIATTRTKLSTSSLSNAPGSCWNHNMSRTWKWFAYIRMTQKFDVILSHFDHKSHDCRFESLAISHRGALKLISPLWLLTNLKIFSKFPEASTTHIVFFNWKHLWLEYVDIFWDVFFSEISILKKIIFFYFFSKKKRKFKKNNRIFQIIAPKNIKCHEHDQNFPNI